MANFPSAVVTYTDQVANVSEMQEGDVNAVYDDVEAIGLHFESGHAMTSNGGFRLTLADGGVDIAYTGQKAVDDLAGTAQTVVAAGTGDVAVGAVVAYMVKPSTGSAQGGVVTIYNGETVDIYNDQAGNQVTLAVAAGGAMTVTRAAGTKTYDVGINVLIWM